MTENPITERLKAIRNRAGLTVRTMAHMLDLSLGGYSHYENPSRFKDHYLPMDLAQRIAAIVGARGIDASEVMSLAGVGASQAPDTPTALAVGFAEGDASPWSPPQDGEHNYQALISYLAPQTRHAGTYQINRDMLALGLLAGDIIVTDRRATPASGQLALGNARSPSGQMVAVIGRVFGETLFTMESLINGSTWDLNSSEVAIYHPILAQFRKM